MYKKMLCCLLAFVLVLLSGGVRVILPVYAEPILDGEISTIEMMNDFTDDAVMVVLTHEASLQFVNYTPADFPEIECAEIEDLSSAKGAKVQAVLRGEQLEMDSIGARFMNQDIDIDGFRRILCLKLDNPGKGNVLRAVMALEQREDVYSAEPNYIYQGIEPIETQAIIPPDDHIYGWAAEKIDQEAAWEIETGSTSVFVGVVDSGIDVTHPELRNKVSVTLSMDFADDNFFATQDPLGHGTHVSGIIGAKHNIDELTFSGVCQNIILVSLRVIDSSKQAKSSSLANAINYAEQNEISILNLSMQVTNQDDTPALQAAISNYSGLLCCAAGNSNLNTDDGYGSIPARWNYDNIISVGASTSSDTRASISNYGEVTVDIFAPGEDILSIYPQSLCASNNCTAPGHLRHGYHTLSGTSMAAPFVTGVAALILAHSPYVMRSTIKSIIISSVDHVNAFSGICVSGGRLNAHNALLHSSAHGNVACTYVNATQHRCRCQDCGITWLEDHDIHPGLGTCMRCYQITG